MPSFKDLGVFLHINPETEAQRSYAHALFLSCNSTLHARNSFGLLSPCYCEQKPLNVETTTSSVLFVISKVYDILLQRYSTKKIRVCGKT